MGNRFLFFQKQGLEIKKLKLSICLISYNSSFFIERSVRSLLKQSNNRFELIISDDNSEDNSIEIAKNLIINSKQLPEGGIKIFKARKNYGIIKNSKFVLNNSKGEYFKLLAADDMLAENYVEELFNQDASSTDVFISDIKFTSNNKILHCPERNSRIYKFLNLNRNEQIHLLSIQNPLNASSITVKKSCLCEINAYSYWPVKNIEDWETWLRIWIKGYNYQFSNHTYSIYELNNPNSVDRGLNMSKFIDIFFITIRIIKINYRNFKLISILLINLMRTFKLVLKHILQNKFNHKHLNP